MPGTVIRGQISFDETAPPFDDATVWVILQEATRADAPSREVSRLKIPGYSHSPGGPPLEFSLTAEPLDPKCRYELRVHLDLTSSGQLKAADQITVQSYPVVTQGHPDHVSVQLRRID
jgi:uncharacterized lipoprotein YbaY